MADVANGNGSMNGLNGMNGMNGMNGLNGRQDSKDRWQKMALTWHGLAPDATEL